MLICKLECLFQNTDAISEHHEGTFQNLRRCKEKWTYSMWNVECGDNVMMRSSGIHDDSNVHSGEHEAEGKDRSK